MTFIGRIRQALEANASSIPLPLRRFLSPIIEESAEELAYWRMRKANFRPAALIDVGAYEGTWTQKAQRIFPGCPVLMIEAQEAKRAKLESVCRFTNAQLAITALADREGRELVFYDMETGSSLLPELSDVKRTQRRVITRTLDEVAQTYLKDSGPLFVKMDVQGAELMVLEGAGTTLERTEVLQLELPFVRYNDGAPSLLPIIAWLHERGFVPFDIAGAHRSNGLLTVQIDLLFVRASSPLRQHA